MDMPFLKLLSYFLLLSSFDLASSEVDIPAYFDHYCTAEKSFTSSSSYQFNLNTLFDILYKNATGGDTPKFFNTSYADVVHGEFMCRGDVPIQVCRDCVQDAINRIASECPYNKEAGIWYDQCSLRYSDRSFFSTLDQLPAMGMAGVPLTACTPNPSTPCSRIPSRTCYRNETDVAHAILKMNNSKPDAWAEINKTLNDAVEAATSGAKKFATKEANFSGGSVYTLVQCTPNLSQQFCSKCLHGIMNLVPKQNAFRRGRAQNPSCNLRFGEDRFYYNDDQPPSTASEGLGRPDLTGSNCSPTKANDQYLNNLRNLTQQLSKASNDTKNNGFYSTSVGNKSDTINGLFMCRGDVSLELCHECVNRGIEQLNCSCPNSKEAIIWHDMCMLRYSNRSFFSNPDTLPVHTKPGGDMLETEKKTFNRLLGNTLNDLVAATMNPSERVGVKNFETKTKTYDVELKTLYTLAQCTPNLSSQDCRKCLQGALQNITSCCSGKKGGQVMNPSCNLRFESYRFYNDSKNIVSVPPAYSPDDPGSPGNPGEDNDHSRTIIIAVVSVTVGSIVLLCFGYYYWQRKRSKSYKEILKKNFGSEGAMLESLQFNLATIEAATDKFSTENRIGKGGFGEVFKGILPDGSKIAVKRLSENSSQGLLEFKNEVLLIAKLQHRNLVALLGFCLKDEEKILVYEYVPNKSLDYFLFGSQKPRTLNWLECHKIIGGIARGILYLHEHSRLKIIHRDLKPSNILLDDEMNPKISDFGLARMVGINETRGNTNRIVGTLGYMSPEYIKFGLFSEKSDVFSFGVIVLEIISGKKNINSHHEYPESQYADGLLSNAWKHWRDEKLIEMLDPNLTEAGSHSEIIKCIHIGLLCVQGNPEVRPSMNEVVQYLSNDSIQLPIPQEPAFFIHSQMEPVATTTEMEGQLANYNQYSINEMSKSTLFPR